MAKKIKKENDACKPQTKLWCLSGMAVAIIVLTWLASSSQTWSRVVVTILAALIFIRSMVVNCSKCCQ
ncbi:MAG: hypothetical protein V1866_02550 [archaeon]